MTDEALQAERFHDDLMEISHKMKHYDEAIALNAKLYKDNDGLQYVITQLKSKGDALASTIKGLILCKILETASPKCNVNLIELQIADLNKLLHEWNTTKEQT